MENPAAESTGRKAPWYIDGLNFTCARCGNCCSGAPGYVWIRQQEILAIAELLGMSAAQFERQHTRRAGRRQSLLERGNGDCEFLVHEPDGTSSCAIHPARPLQCRTWPFWTSNLRSRRAWQTAAHHCPGINRGRFHPLPAVQGALRRGVDADLPL